VTRRWSNNLCTYQSETQLPNGNGDDVANDPIEEHLPKSENTNVLLQEVAAACVEAESSGKPSQVIFELYFVLMLQMYIQTTLHQVYV